MTRQAIQTSSGGHRCCPSSLCVRSSTRASRPRSGCIATSSGYPRSARIDFPNKLCPASKVIVVLQRHFPASVALGEDFNCQVGDKVRAVIVLLKSLSPRFADGKAPRVLAIPAAPPATPEAIGRGARVYVKGECAECHGKEARGDGPSAKDLSVRPSDLTRRPFKSGPTAGDIVRTLLTGLDGTPMPSYYQVLEDDELWDLAYWLDSRAGPPETTDDERAGWHVERMHQRRAR